MAGIGEEHPSCGRLSTDFWGIDREGYCIFWCAPCKATFRQPKNSDDTITPPVPILAGPLCDAWGPRAEGVCLHKSCMDIMVAEFTSGWWTLDDWPDAEVPF